MKKTLFIIRGLPGSGKSTAAEILATCNVSGNLKTFPICTADDFFMRDGEYKFNASQLGAAHDSCKKKVLDNMKVGIEKIFVANTSTTQAELNPYYKMAEEYDYQVVSLIVENRHNGENIHNVPNEALERMRARFDIKL